MPIGITEGNPFRKVAGKAQILTLLTRHDALEVYGLPRTIYGTVGEQSGRILLTTILVGCSEKESTFGQQHIIVLTEIDEKRIVVFHLVVQEDLAIFVGLHCRQDGDLVLTCFVVPLAAVEFHGDSFHGFPRLAVHNNHSNLVVHLIDNVAKSRHLEVECQDFILVFRAFFGAGHKIVDALV